MSHARFILVLAGALFSGKTTLARSIAAATGATHLSFGDLIRREAGSRDISADRSSLQTLGTALLKDLGPRAFCERALSSGAVTTETRPVIWDGVRHVSVLDELRRLYAPAEVTLVALAPPELARRRRLSAQTSSSQELHDWEAHESESQLPQLIAQADLLCDATSPDAAAARVLELLGAGP